MRSILVALAGLAAAVALVAAIVRWTGAPDRPASLAAPLPPTALAAASPAPPAASATAVAAASSPVVDVPLPAAAVAPVMRPAVESLAAERLRGGDERAPPIDPPEEGPPPATPWEAADPARYAAREQRMNEQVRAQFVQAAEARLPALRAAVDRMKREGLPADQIAMAEDKLRHMEAVHDAVVRGEPLGASAPQ